jgi:hypothetical protein
VRLDPSIDLIRYDYEVHSKSTWRRPHSIQQGRPSDPPDASNWNNIRATSLTDREVDAEEGPFGPPTKYITQADC